jgi:hypothetical protein
VNKITFGGKHKWKPDDNPAVGSYNPSPIKPRVKSALIREDVYPYKRPKERVPSPG